MAKEVSIDLSHLTDDELEELDVALRVELLERDTEFWQELEVDHDEHQRTYTIVKQWGHA